jgi:hypothetical protein
VLPVGTSTENLIRWTWKARSSIPGAECEGNVLGQAGGPRHADPVQALVRALRVGVVIYNDYT